MIRCHKTPWKFLRNDLLMRLKINSNNESILTMSEAISNGMSSLCVLQRKFHWWFNNCKFEFSIPFPRKWLSVVRGLVVRIMVGNDACTT